jgi:hypothetical protein
LRDYRDVCRRIATGFVVFVNDAMEEHATIFGLHGEVFFFLKVAVTLRWKALVRPFELGTKPLNGPRAN